MRRWDAGPPDRRKGLQAADAGPDADKRLSTRRVKHVRITSAAPLYTQVDGEILCDKAHQIDIKVIPACLRLICPKSDG
jgi:diacylglycerol kinase family enzyme